MTDHSEAAVFNEHRNNNGAAGPTKLPVSSSLQGLEALNSETVDLEHIPLDEVFEQLRCSKEGLTTEEGEIRLEIFGFNKLEEKPNAKGMDPPFTISVGFCISMIPLSCGNYPRGVQAGFDHKTTTVA
ncbi:unnamed protein product [Sphagnum jensenii]|uniref:Cation-transporting P-type ATPase N-terminal domain-containing protein n=1 Tax=Sphagnum jensenii TaxID=128206 RepID=A0ABP1AUA2_9BRYO